MPLESTHPIISRQEFEQLFESLKNWAKWGDHDERGTINIFAALANNETNRVHRELHETRGA